jgi:hypothetical protein
MPGKPSIRVTTAACKRFIACLLIAATRLVALPM